MPSSAPKYRPATYRPPDTNRGSAHARGYTRAWAVIRKAFLQRSPLCHDCGREKPPRVEPATEVHHLVKLAEGGTHDESNLLGLCKRHHSIRTARGE